MNWLLNKIRSYRNDRSGVNAIIFAFVLPTLVAAGGLAVDLANAYNVRNKLSQALDKAALATANSTGTEDELREIAQNFLEANFRVDGLGVLLEPTITFNGNVISVSASAQVDMTLMQIFGMDHMLVSASSEVTRALSGIEVVLVLDVTGSMAGENIVALKDSATQFINKMFDEISDVDLIKIGIVPYSAAVNVGSYGFGMWPDGSYYGATFVERPASDLYKNPADIEYNTGDDEDWHGCVLAEDYPADTLDNTTTGFGMYRYPRYCAWYYHGSCYYYYGKPNDYCPRTSLVPLTNDQQKLLDAVDDLYPEGSTYGNLGMVWGWRVISPEEPFTEGTAYDDAKWEKAIVMMTDGDNTMDSYYSAYGKTNSHNLTADDLDTRLSEICENMKQSGITVYTITFQSSINNETKALYENCATDPSMYEHAPSSDKLVEIFDDIANQLSKLHISK